MNTASNGPAPRIRVLLADDHALVRSGIRALLAAMHDVEVVGEAGDGSELLAMLARDDPPDLVITDLSMPGMDGLTAITRIRAAHPSVRVLVLSMSDTLDFVTGAVSCGACGYLMKDAAPHELAQAVRSVMDEGRYYGTAVAQLLLKPPVEDHSEDLTERQREILVLLANGRSSKEIGHQLGLSAKTVDVHRSRIMERLNLRDVASLTRYALRKGLVQP